MVRESKGSQWTIAFQITGLNESSKLDSHFTCRCTSTQQCISRHSDNTIGHVLYIILFGQWWFQFVTSICQFHLSLIRWHHPKWQWSCKILHPARFCKIVAILNGVFSVISQKLLPPKVIKMWIPWTKNISLKFLRTIGNCWLLISCHQSVLTALAGVCFPASRQINSASGMLFLD